MYRQQIALLVLSGAPTTPLLAAAVLLEAAPMGKRKGYALYVQYQAGEAAGELHGDGVDGGKVPG